jgi:hypothetical protein
MKAIPAFLFTLMLLPLVGNGSSVVTYTGEGAILGISATGTDLVYAQAQVLIGSGWVTVWGQTFSPRNSFTATPTYTPLLPGSYQVRVDIRDALDQTASDFGVINVPNRPPDPPAISMTGTPIMGEDVTFSLSASDPDNNLHNLWLQVQRPSGSWSDYNKGGNFSPTDSHSSTEPFTFTYSSPSSFGLYRFRSAAEDTDGVTVYSSPISASPSNPTKVVQIKAKNMPDPDLAIWFNDSSVTAENITVHKYRE